MAKKQKSQQFQKKNTIQQGTPAELCVSTLSPWWSAPVISDKQYYGWVSSAGYGITAFLFGILSLYFYMGYTVRPRILDREIITRIMNPPSGASYEIYPIGPADSITPARLNGESNGILFKCSPGAPVGFLVSKNMLTLPEDIKNFDISVCSAFQGSPSINFGFTNRIPQDYQLNWNDFFLRMTMASLEQPPSQDQMRYYVTMPGHFYAPSQFEVPWNSAKYFFFLITAPIKTEIFMEKMIFVEKR